MMKSREEKYKTPNKYKFVHFFAFHVLCSIKFIKDAFLSPYDLIKIKKIKKKRSIDIIV